MAKNRFNTRASWDSSFKYTGQLMPRQSVSIDKSTPKKEYLKPQQLQFLKDIQEAHYNQMNDWERSFVKGIVMNKVKLTEKQKEIIRRIIKKY